MDLFSSIEKFISKGASLVGGAEITFALNNSEERQQILVSPQENTYEYIYEGREAIEGTVTVTPNRTPLLHSGATIQFLGELFLEFGDTEIFTSKQKNLQEEGEITEPITFSFSFKDIPKPFESYKGHHVRLRYFLRFELDGVTKKEYPVWIRNYQIGPPKEISKKGEEIKMDIGVKDQLHLEFHCAKTVFHTQDVIIGKVFFMLVKVKIEIMEIWLIKEEYSEGGTPIKKEKVICEHQIMDGAPLKGEVIPLRLYLERYNLTPTYQSVLKKFNVKYYLKLILLDVASRRYFRKQEITLWRSRPSPSTTKTSSDLDI
mmetsp:Transcript_12969/g.17552  ORF Transcript_12969/g.17552 Transcript_12969/m.17552 type:complete len:317 (-) Transcript_12969:96-1046(-)